jgi:peptide/nickel transport system substrate-binding protein
MRKLARTGTGVAALALVGAAALAGCGASSTSSLQKSTAYPGGIGAIPPAASGAKHATTFTFALPPGAVPFWILPINGSSDNTVFNAFTFQDEMWRPLYWTVNGVEPEVVNNMSLASQPVWSNGDKTLSITMNSGYKWSDGKPMTAQNLQLAIDVIKAGVDEPDGAPNWAAFVPGYFPDDMTSNSISGNTLTINLKTSVNPEWFTEDILSSVNPLPLNWAIDATNGPQLDWTVPANATKIFNYLSAQSKSVSTYASNPLWQTVDGPYHLTAFNSTTGAFTMEPNATYGGPHASPMSAFQGVPFTSDTAEFNAVKAGQIDVGYVPPEDVPQLGQLKGLGYSYFGEPDFGMTFANYNFKDTTGDFDNIVSQLYFRQAMAHLENEDGYVKAFMDGAGGDAYGPIPAYPQSPFLPSNAATNPYPFSTSAAAALLKANGWTVTPGGTDTCAKQGTAAGDCGAGIPAGTKLSFNLIYSTTPALIGQQMTSLAGSAKQVGITINLQTSNFNYMVSNYIDPADPSNESKWAMMDFGGETDATYPTTFGLFNTGGGSQIGDYSDPTADTLILNSINSSNPAAVTKEAQFLTTNEPVLFEPNPDLIATWKSSISATLPQAFANLTQYYATPEYWYTTK